MAQTLSLVAGMLTLYLSGGYAIADNVGHAVEESLKAHDYRIIVRGGRGGRAPGVAEAEQEQAISRCGRRFLAGFADVVLPGEERAYSNLETYASEYNRLMLKHCFAATNSGH